MHKIIAANIDKINENGWNALSRNTSPVAIQLIQDNIFKLDSNCWCILSFNPSAIELLEANPDKIYWEGLSQNPNAINLLEANLDKVNWNTLSRNPNAIHILEANLDKVNWDMLSDNPNAIHLLEANMDKIHWYIISKNPNAVHLIQDRLTNRGNNIRDAFDQRISWAELSDNLNAVPLFDLYLEHICWNVVSRNPNAWSYIEQHYPEKIDCRMACLNPNPDAMPFVKAYIEKLISEGCPDEEIPWNFLSINPAAVKLLLDVYPDKINWDVIWQLPAIFETCGSYI